MEKTIIVCGIVRDAERGLRHNMPVIERVVEKFRSYNIILFENDSSDSTKEVLNHWQSIIGDRLVIVSEDIGMKAVTPIAREVNSNPFYSYMRINKMAELRNQYMSYIESNSLIADYLMVVDLDVVNISMDGIMSSFEMGVEWDAVTANGYSLSPKLRRRYHDSYALAEYGDEINPQTEGKILRMSEKYASLHPGDDPVRVFSAFGGLAIYRFDAVAGLRYSAIPNDDSRVEVRCEHFSIYKQMAERGYTRTYINPSMQIKYQRLTLKIIINSLKRRLVK